LQIKFFAVSQDLRNYWWLYDVSSMMFIINWSLDKVAILQYTHRNPNLRANLQCDDLSAHQAKQSHSNCKSVANTLFASKSCISLCTPPLVSNSCKFSMQIACITRSCCTTKSTRWTICEVATDDVDNNPTSTTAKTSFHGTSLILHQSRDHFSHKSVDDLPKIHLCSLSKSSL